MSNSRLHPTLAIPTNNGLIFINETEILYSVADGAYTKIYIENGEILVVAKTLSKVLTSLSDDYFIRIHNSHFINLLHTRGYSMNEKHSVTMSNGVELAVSRNRKDEFLNRFSKL